MKPNGLVAAACTTSQTSTPSRSHINAISLASPMLTARNVFSSSFTISATCGELTGTMRSMADEYNAPASAVDSGSTPPTTFGTLCVLNIGLPGSTRSGENARKKSAPAFRPPASSSGLTNSSVVPGYVVDSRITSIPGRRYFATPSTADATNDMSGSFVLRSGVGTQMLMVSSDVAAAKLVVARSRPAATSDATSSDF